MCSTIDSTSHPSLRLDWEAVLASLPNEFPTPHSPFWFGGDKSLSDELIHLVKTGRKTATASLLWEWQAEGLKPPSRGEVHLLLDWSNTPLGTLTNVDIQIMPFSAVSTEFAAKEGEGDLSLEWWRNAHLAYFTQVCKNINRSPSADMPVVCQEFVFQSLAGTPPSTLK